MKIEEKMIKIKYVGGMGYSVQTWQGERFLFGKDVDLLVPIGLYRMLMNTHAGRFEISDSYSDESEVSKTSRKK